MRIKDILKYAVWPITIFVIITLMTDSWAIRGIVIFLVVGTVYWGITFYQNAIKEYKKSDEDEY